MRGQRRSEPTIRVGVIGVGRMGERHCRVLSNLASADFVGVSDLNGPMGSEIAAKYGVAYFPNYHDLLAQVDAVSVVTPTRTHFAIARDCILAGVHVLIEKPIADTLEQARQLAHLADQSGCVVQVGHIERFNPTFLELQAILEDMTVVALSARRLSPFDTSNTDVDVIRDLMIHDIDIAMTLLGDDLDRIDASGRAAKTIATDYAVATLSYASGPVATLTASRVTEQKVRLLEVTAMGAYIEADLLNKSVCIHRRNLQEYVFNHQRPMRYRQESLVEQIHIPTAEPLLLELQDFLRCAGDAGTPKVTARDGLRALEVATCILDQLGANRGTPILAATA
jgi:virulence factor